jgi:hypothetical protein
MSILHLRMIKLQPNSKKIIKSKNEWLRSGNSLKCSWKSGQKAKLDI